MSIVHKQISPIGPTGIESERWDQPRLLQHLALIGPDKNHVDKSVGLSFSTSEERRAYKRKVDEMLFTETDDGERLREVPGHRHYYTTETGAVYSGRNGKLRKMKLGKGRYVTIMGRHGNPVDVSADTLTNMAWE